MGQVRLHEVCYLVCYILSLFLLLYVVPVYVTGDLNSVPIF